MNVNENIFANRRSVENIHSLGRQAGLILSVTPLEKVISTLMTGTAINMLIKRLKQTCNDSQASESGSPKMKWVNL